MNTNRLLEIWDISAFCVPVADIEQEIENRSGGSGELLGTLGSLGFTAAQLGLLATLFGIQSAPTAINAYNGLSTIDLQDPATGRLVLQILILLGYHIVTIGLA